MGATLEQINVKYFEMAIPYPSRGRHQNQDYSARCPFCGDGSKNNSKRFHLFTKTSFDGDMLKCFNGDCAWEQPSGMRKFLKELNPSLYNAYVQEINGEKISALAVFRDEEQKDKKQKEDTLVIESMSITAETDRPNKLFNVPNIFLPIEKGDYAYNYLKTRLVEDEDMVQFMKVDNDNSYYSFKGSDGKTNKKNLKGFIVIPLFYRDKLYGFTTRSTESKEFYTRIPEENSGLKVWNWYNVEKNEPTYIFEATFDAKSITSKNVVACLGADLPMDKIKQLKEPIFVFDNDKTGRVKAQKYATEGYKVMVWPDIIHKDFNSILQRGGKREQLQKFLDKHVYKGMSASVRLKL